MPRLLVLRWAAPSLSALAAIWSVAGPALAEARDLAAATAACKRASERQVAIEACSTVIASSRDRLALERAYNVRGLANEALGQFRAAADDASQVIRLDPKIAGYYDNRMRAYRGLGLLDQALQDANTAVAMAPGYAFVLHGRGGVRYDRGEYDQAVADYGKALDMGRGDAGLLVDRGRALMKLGRSDEAVRDFSEAHDVSPAFTAALRERGLAQARLGNADAARPDLQAALAGNPSDDEAAAALRSLDASDRAQPQRLAQGSPSPDAERLEREARDRLKAREDEQRQRQGTVDRLKAERLARARAEAQRLRGEAGEFVKANRDDPQLMDHLQRIADLGAALPGGEPAPIERATSLLSADLASDPIYAAYAEHRRMEKGRDDERNLAVALSALRVQRGFLVGEVVKDPTGDDAPTFLSLAKQADAVLGAPELGRAQAVTGAIDAAIARAKMTDRYEEARRAAPLDKTVP